MMAWSSAASGVAALVPPPLQGHTPTHELVIAKPHGWPSTTEESKSKSSNPRRRRTHAQLHTSAGYLLVVWHQPPQQPTVLD